MLEQKTPNDPVIDTVDSLLNPYALEQSEIIERTEACIDPEKKLYLFTWSPDPSQLPNADFHCQHDFAMELVAKFLCGCNIGIACVESSQLGNPHYHGWYQVSEDSNKELMRICYSKVLTQYGILKITKSKGCFRLNSYTKAGNCLYYYKKDLFGSMAMVSCNPVVAGMISKIDPNPWWFDIPGKKYTVADLENKISNRKFYEEFYRNSGGEYKKN